jgi:sarcosine oxidase subunit beta
MPHLMSSENPHEYAKHHRLDRFRTGHGLMDEEGTGSQHNLH